MQLSATKTSSLLIIPSECFMVKCFFLVQSYWMLNLRKCPIDYKENQKGWLHFIRNNFASVIFIFTKLGRDKY